MTKKYFETVTVASVLVSTRIIADMETNLNNSVKGASNLIMARLLDGQTIEDIKGLIKNDTDSLVDSKVPKGVLRACSGADIIFQRVMENKKVPTNASHTEFLTLDDLQGATDKFEYSFETLSKYSNAFDKAVKDAENKQALIERAEAKKELNKTEASVVAESDTETETEQTDLEKGIILVDVLDSIIENDITLAQDIVNTMQGKIDDYYAEQKQLSDDAEQALKTA